MASRFSSLSATALARSFIVGWLVVILLAVSLGLYLLDSSLEQQRQRTALETENLAVLVSGMLRTPWKKWTCCCSMPSITTPSICAWAI